MRKIRGQVDETVHIRPTLSEVPGAVAVCVGSSRSTVPVARVLGMVVSKSAYAVADVLRAAAGSPAAANCATPQTLVTAPHGCPTGACQPAAAQAANCAPHPGRWHCSR